MLLHVLLIMSMVALAQDQMKGSVSHYVISVYIRSLCTSGKLKHANKHSINSALEWPFGL